MNTITITHTKNVKAFEPPKLQGISFILKSLPLFRDKGIQVTYDDTFTWDKENGVYILIHYNTEYNEKKPILAVSEDVLKNISTQELHASILDLVHYAWIEKLI